MKSIRYRGFALFAATLALVACDGQSTSAVLDEPRYARGERTFELRCFPCHHVEERWSNIGPYLAGLNGRRAGTLSDFDYSPAMRAFDIEWDADALEAFLVDPVTTVPGTKMIIDPVADPANRAALVYYLMQQQ